MTGIFLPIESTLPGATYAGTPPSKRSAGSEHERSESRHSKDLFARQKSNTCSSGARSSKKCYPEQVTCYKYVYVYTVKPVTSTAKKTSTVTAPRPTSTKMVSWYGMDNHRSWELIYAQTTTTVTMTSTSVPGDASITVGAARPFSWSTSADSQVDHNYIDNNQHGHLYPFHHHDRHDNPGTLSLPTPAVVEQIG